MWNIKKHFRGGLGPDIDVFFSATGTEFTLTGKREDFRIATMGTDEGSKATFVSTTFKHFFYFRDGIDRKIIFIEVFEERPIIISLKNVFERKFLQHITVRLYQ